MKAKYALDEFVQKAVNDHRLYPAHISLFVALFYSWKEQNYSGPLDIRREELMKRSKIAGRGTYQRCLKELHAGGFIKYEPSFNRFGNAKISVLFQSSCT